MQGISKILSTGAIALSLSVAAIGQQSSTPATANDTYQKQSQGNAVGTPAPPPTAPAANPGFGPQAPNDSTLSGGQPHSNSTYQKDRNGNQGLDLGWIGLLGLAGLFGIGRGRQTHSHEMSHDSGTTRG